MKNIGVWNTKHMSDPTVSSSCLQTLGPVSQRSWRTMSWAWGKTWRYHVTWRTTRSPSSGSKTAPGWFLATGRGWARGCCASSTCRTRTRAFIRAGSHKATRCSATTPSGWQVNGIFAHEIIWWFIRNNTCFILKTIKILLSFIWARFCHKCHPVSKCQFREFLHKRLSFCGMETV